MIWSDSTTRRRIETRLREYLNEPHLRVSVRPEHDGLIMLRLDPERTILDEGGTPWLLRSLPVGSTVRSYWFGITARFEGYDDKELRSAAIVLACGLRSAEPAPLARAECDVRDVMHAQPHWHIYAKPAAAPVRGLEHLHWAMAAQWASLGNSPLAHSSAIESDEQLARWIGGCAAYLVQQLGYLESRLPQTKNYFESGGRA